LLQDFPRSLLFIDEGGRSNPEPLLPGPRYFALGGVAINEEDAEAYIQEADRIKLQFFERKEITFHEPDMRSH